MSLFVLWLLTLFLFCLGLMGIFIPAVPGIGLIFAGVLLFAWVTGFGVISTTTVIVVGIVALLAWLADYVGALMGAKMGGGKWRTLAGTFLGGVLGLLAAGPAGLVLGVFIGAMVGAFSEGMSVEGASRAALLALVGLIGATFVQFVLAIGIIAAFLVAVIW